MNQIQSNSFSGYILQGSKFLHGNKMQSGIITIEDKFISSIEINITDQCLEKNYPIIDLSGFWVLPGIIDLHGDGFERQFFPRPGVSFDINNTFKIVDKELSINGITKAYLACSYSWEGRIRSPEYAKIFLDNLNKYKPSMLTNIDVQIRYETHLVEKVHELIDLIIEHELNYVVFNNHIPDAIDKIQNKPSAFATWANKMSMEKSELENIVNYRVSKENEVNNSLKILSDFLKSINIKFGSHDDESIEDRKWFRSFGAKICEFPTTIEAAKEAHSKNENVIMGAPNLVRGGSHNGNVSTLELLELEYCNILVSDYYYPSLLQSIWYLLDQKICSIENAWALISENPAKAINIDKRGAIKVNNYADLVIINPKTREIEATICNGKIANICKSVADRFIRSSNSVF